MAELPLTMPKMSMTMEEGTMVSWLKQVGDPVRSGEPICEVATDKVDMEVESPFDGVLARITAEIDEVIKVGDTIALITTDADDLLGGLFDEPAPDAAAAEPAIENAATQQATAEASDGGSQTGTDWPAAVPRARVLAAENGVGLASLTPTGPWGTIRVDDVESAIQARGSVEAAPTTTAPAAALTAAADPVAARRRRVRLQTAKVMSLSATVPQFTAFVDLDLGPLAAVRKTELGGASWTALLIRAQAAALRAHPELNAFWSDQGPVENVHIGVALAVDSPTGLLAPVLRDPDTIPLATLVGQLATLVDEARRGAVNADSLSGGTTVFSNLGGLGVDYFNALLTPPQATALSAGAVGQKIVVSSSGAFSAKLMCTVGLTVDHRVADGGDAARYLGTLKKLIADPAALSMASQ